MARAKWGTALVTGASSGIGRAFAVAFARRGSDVVVVARRREALEELAAELARDHGVSVEVLVADLVDPEQLAAVEARVSDPARPVDVLVNNAGFGTEGRFWELPLAREDEQVRVNVLVPTRLTRAALPGMVERGHGAVVNVSSVAGLQPIPHWATYSASKSYLITLTRAVEEELRGTGVHAMALMPGFTHTEFHDHMGFNRKYIPGPAWMTADAVAESALKALARGRGSRIPGLRNRVVAFSSWISPWAITRRVLGFATRRMR